LQNYGRHTKQFDLIGRLQRRLFNYGRLVNKVLCISGYVTDNIPLSGSHHAGVPPTDELNLPVIPESAYAAALKEYEDLDETDSEGDGLGW
jgi:hypothetical protein